MIGFTARAAACALAVVLVACQPVDELGDVDESVDGGGSVDGERRGAPDTGPPDTLADVLARADAEAARWQQDARLAEIAVEVDGEGHMTQARLTYLAAEADRLLAVAVTGDGLREERPMLGALDLTPITGDALDALPALPDDVREPAALMEAVPTAFAACDVSGDPATVLYASGAPLAWDPDQQAWAAPLAWTITVTDGEGEGAVLDPVTAETVDCVGAAG